MSVKLWAKTKTGDTTHLLSLKSISDTVKASLVVDRVGFELVLLNELGSTGVKLSKEGSVLLACGQPLVGERLTVKTESFTYHSGSRTRCRLTLWNPFPNRV